MRRDASSTKVNYAKTAAVQARILDATADLLRLVGPMSTTIAAVAAAAGMSTPGVLYHFPNKVTLLAAARHRIRNMEIKTGAEGSAVPSAIAQQADVLAAATVGEPTIAVALRQDVSEMLTLADPTDEHASDALTLDRVKSAREIVALEIGFAILRVIDRGGAVAVGAPKRPPGTDADRPSA